MTACLFCALVAAPDERSTVYEDDRLVAFMDLHPVNPGHVLLVPRNHAPGMGDLDEDTGAHIFRTAMRMQQAIRNSGVRCEGINVFVADGEAAFQEIPHFHLHVFPRFKGDSFKVEADWKQASRADLDRIAADIHSAYEERWR